MSKGVPTPPKELRNAAVATLLKSRKEPSPENLLAISRKKTAPLHAFFYGRPDKEWAEFGRYEAARRIIRECQTELVIGGVTIETRAIEFVRVGDDQRYARIEDIINDPRMLEAYMAEVQGLLEQAQDKMTRIRALVEGKRAA